MTASLKTCTAPNCDRPALTRGYCFKHYQQIQRHGRLTPERENGRYPLWCQVGGCESKTIAKGYCWKHYQQLRRHGRLTPEREHSYGRIGCKVEGCGAKHYARGFCVKHYNERRYAQRKAQKVGEWTSRALEFEVA